MGYPNVNKNLTYRLIETVRSNNEKRLIYQTKAKQIKSNTIIKQIDSTKTISHFGRINKSFANNGTRDM